MHRAEIIETIRHYQAFVERNGHPHGSFDLPEETDIINKLMMFIESTPDCFERTCKPGHVTGSAMVISPDFQKVLLTLHGKLNKWLQLGGHSDGNHLTHEVSLREVEEESGVIPIKIYEPLRVFSPGIKLPDKPLPFDFDYHFIPARKSEPDHIHYDVRYLVIAIPQNTEHINMDSLYTVTSYLLKYNMIDLDLLMSHVFNFIFRSSFKMNKI